MMEKIYRIHVRKKMPRLVIVSDEQKPNTTTIESSLYHAPDTVIMHHYEIIAKSIPTYPQKSNT
jgi:hypothetical protein